MFQNKTTKVLLGGFLVAAAVLCLPTQAYAWSWGGGHRGQDRGYPHHERYPYGSISVGLPHGFVQLGFGGRHYFYNAGLFYMPRGPEYVVVPPPTGVVVYTIPDGGHQVVIDGVLYYVYNGIYYARGPQGYQVVQPPAPVIVEPVTVSANIAPAPAQGPEEFTINIPNTKGSGYVSVVIKRSGTGFTGPQGEFYAEFPKVTQLQAMYGK